MQWLKNQRGKMLEHCVGMDTETAGLEKGSEVYVVACYNTKTKESAHFVSDGSSDRHIWDAYRYMERAGLPVATFNGTAFDFAMMAAATSDKTLKKCLATMALEKNYDIMLQFAADNGYFSSLASFSVPTLDRGKIGSGGSVEEAWASNDAEKRQGVIDYCIDDAKLTAELFTYGSNWGRLQRKTKNGKVNTWTLPCQPVWRPAAVCLANTTTADFLDNPPDVSGMADWTLEHL